MKRLNGVKKTAKWSALGFVAINLLACQAVVDERVMAEKILKSHAIERDKVIKQSPNEISKAMYLSRWLMSGRERQKVEQQLGVQSKQWQYQDNPFQITGASRLTNNPNQPKIKAGMDYIGEDGLFVTQNVDKQKSDKQRSTLMDGWSIASTTAHESVEQMWMPAYFQGVYLDSPIMATNKANFWITTVLEQTIKSFGLSPQMVLTEKVEDIRYQFTLSDDDKYRLSVGKRYPTLSEQFTISIKNTGFKKITKNDPVESLSLGFTPEYKTAINGFSVTLVDAEGRDATHFAFGREFFRRLSQKLPFIKASDHHQDGLLFYAGSVYQFSSKSYERFVDKKIIH